MANATFPNLPMVVNTTLCQTPTALTQGNGLSMCFSMTMPLVLLPNGGVIPPARSGF